MLITKYEIFQGKLLETRRMTVDVFFFIKMSRITAKPEKSKNNLTDIWAQTAFRNDVNFFRLNKFTNQFSFNLLG